jgi:hypothetical protein
MMRSFWFSGLLAVVTLAAATFGSGAQAAPPPFHRPMVAPFANNFASQHFAYTPPIVLTRPNAIVPPASPFVPAAGIMPSAATYGYWLRVNRNLAVTNAINNPYLYNPYLYSGYNPYAYSGYNPYVYPSAYSSLYGYGY